MTNQKKPLVGGARTIKVSLPDAVANYYESQARHYNTSVSAAASPVLCALAYGEIKNEFTKQPGADVGRP